METLINILVGGAIFTITYIIIYKILEYKNKK